MRLELDKLIQAAAVLLKEEARHEMSYLRLMKLLYIANRTALKESGTLVVPDRMVAMDKGPVLSTALNVVKGQSLDSTEWDRFICRDRYRIGLRLDPNISSLSKYEVDLLQRVSEEYSHLDDWELVEETHQFSEWKDNYVPGTSRDISLHGILAAIGCADESEAIVNELMADAARSELLAKAQAEQ